MKVIPVIDVLNGAAVHGVQGKREQYQPLKSVLCSSAEPLEIASAFSSLGFSSIYMADLDAIIKDDSRNFGLYRRIVDSTGLSLMVDAGIADMKRAVEVLSAGASEIVVGTETLRSLEFVGQAVDAFGAERIVVSVDQKGGQLLSTSKEISSMDALSLTKELSRLGVHRIILLDLSRVGTERGINSTLLKDILKQGELEVMVGGGIRNLSEMKELRELGVAGALVATVIHNGKVTVDELRVSGFI